MGLLSQIFNRPAINQVEPAQVQEMLAKPQRPFLLDVRTPEEYIQGHIHGAELIPLNELSAKKGRIPKEREVVCVCATGSRSSAATRGYRISKSVVIVAVAQIVAATEQYFKCASSIACLTAFSVRPPPLTLKCRWILRNVQGGSASCSPLEVISREVKFIRFFARIPTTSTAEQAATAMSSMSEGLIPIPSSTEEITTEWFVESIPINFLQSTHLTVVVPILFL
jgi:hypothetical protein